MHFPLSPYDDHSEHLYNWCIPMKKINTLIPFREHSRGLQGAAGAFLREVPWDFTGFQGTLEAFQGVSRSLGTPMGILRCFRSVYGVSRAFHGVRGRSIWFQGILGVFWGFREWFHGCSRMFQGVLGAFQGVPEGFGVGPGANGILWGFKDNLSNIYLISSKP